VFSLEVKYDPASRLKLLLTFSIEGSLVMICTNLEQFLQQSLVANYIFITRNYNTQS
jgi:hypothetical protein